MVVFLGLSAALLAGCSSSSTSDITAPDFTGFSLEEAQLIGDKRGIDVEKIGPARCVNVGDPNTGLALKEFPAEVEGQDIEPGQIIPETPDRGSLLVTVLLDCSPEVGLKYFGLE